MEERVKEKFKFAYENFLIIEENIKNVKTMLEIKGILKVFQEMAEAIFDALTLILKQKGFESKDKYSNLETLFSINVISLEEKELLKKINGLRNWIVHKYNKIDEKIALNEIKNLLPKIKKFLEKWK